MVENRNLTRGFCFILYFNMNSIMIADLMIMLYYIVDTYSSLGKLIHFLLRTGTSSFEHIEESLLIRSKSDYFTN